MTTIQSVTYESTNLFEMCDTDFELEKGLAAILTADADI